MKSRIVTSYGRRITARDSLMWDNCSVQHKASFGYDLPLRRLTYRGTVRGTEPF